MLVEQLCENLVMAPVVVCRSLEFAICRCSMAGGVEKDPFRFNQTAAVCACGEDTERAFAHSLDADEHNSGIGVERRLTRQDCGSNLGKVSETLDTIDRAVGLRRAGAWRCFSRIGSGSYASRGAFDGVVHLLERAFDASMSGGRHGVVSQGIRHAYGQVPLW